MVAYEFRLLLQTQKEAVVLGRFATIDQGRNYWRILGSYTPRADKISAEDPALTNEETLQKDEEDTLQEHERYELDLAGFELWLLPEEGETRLVYSGDYTTDEC